MTNDDFKELLDEAIKPLKDAQDEFRKELNEVKNTIDARVLPPLIYIETTVKSYADQYITVEEDLGIQPPQELTIPLAD